MNIINRFYQLFKVRNTQKNFKLFLNEKEAGEKLIHNFLNATLFFEDIFKNNIVTEKEVPLLLSCIKSFYPYSKKIDNNNYENGNIQKELIMLQAYTHPYFIKTILNDNKYIKNFIEFGKGYDSLDSKKLLGNVMDSFLNSELLYSREGIKRFNDCITIINKAATQKNKKLYSRTSILFNAFTWSKDDINEEFYEKIYIAVKEISNNNKQIFNKVESVKFSMQNRTESKQLPNFFSFYDFKDNYNSTLWDNCKPDILIYALENNFFCHESKENIKKVLFDRGIITSIWTQCNYLQLKQFCDYMDNYSGEDFFQTYLKHRTNHRKITYCYYIEKQKKLDSIMNNMDLNEEKKKLNFIFEHIKTLANKTLFYSTLSEAITLYHSITRNSSDYFSMEEFLINDILFTKDFTDRKYKNIVSLGCLTNEGVLSFFKNIMAIPREMHQFDIVLKLIKSSFSFDEKFITDQDSYFWQGNHIWSSVDHTNKEKFKKFMHIKNEKDHLTSVIEVNESKDIKKQRRL